MAKTGGWSGLADFGGSGSGSELTLGAALKFFVTRFAVMVMLVAALAPPAYSQAPPTPAAATAQAGAKYVGSRACQSCHAGVYARWQKTPMANIVRDPREHPEAILPDLATDTIAKFTKDDVGLVYGSIWKQRYFTKVGDDYYPEPAQWDIVNKVWRAYFVANGTDWWATHYPPDNFKRPTSALCDGCHSVNFSIQDHSVTEWNVGCERCHGPGSEHAAKPSRANIFNPARQNYVAASDTCIQCHSQGQPLGNPIEGKYYDWPVGFRVGLDLADFWKLEEHKLGDTTFTHFPDGTAHKNRMQGNDFVQSVMYRRGVTCFSCHDVHGTSNYAQLRAPVNQLCLTCHAAGGPNGPRTATLEAHTHHKAGTPGSECVDCHMPKIETEIANFNVSAHTFAFITPAMTDQYKIPSPCTSCHTDKTTAWAADALRHWPERSPWRVE
jgi:predicted CXXCH cytochrome family protein